MRQQERNAEGNDDADLMACVASGERFALDELHRRYTSAVFARTLRICRDESLADEATQDVFVQAWRTAADYDPARGTVRCWLLTIARTRALDRLRARHIRDGRLAPLDDLEMVSDIGRRSSPEQSAYANEHTALFETLLSILPDDDRHLIDLAFFKGLTHAEMAAALSQPLGTVKTRVRRILQLLHTAIAARTPAPFVWSSWRRTPVAAASSASSLQDLNVLAVDDDADTLKLLTMVLERAGAAVVGAASADHALNRLGTVWPDLLVIDLEMPGRDGYQLLEHVRGLPGGCDLPAIAFTAHGADRDRDLTRRAGFALHLPKPVKPSTLVVRICELVARNRKSSELSENNA